MIKELIQFTEQARKDLGQIGVQPKEGLYIQLRLENEDGHWSLDVSKKQTAFFSGKKQDWMNDAVLRKANTILQSSWMVNTNKCFDLPTKAVHSCSPYVVAFKKDSLETQPGKVSLANRLDGYFLKAKELLADDDGEKNRLDVFKNTLNADDKLLSLLHTVEGFSEVKEKEYIVIFLDEDLEKYHKCHERYLRDKLFNTNDYPNSNPEGEPMGTSDFFNGFNSKKPFLLHKTAWFDIPGRVTATEAKALFDFKDLLFGRRVFPNPLPIFIYDNEGKNPRNGFRPSIQLFKEDADREQRVGFAEMMGILHAKDIELANFYLLNHGGVGEIRDFDFVSQFKYEVNWQVEDLFEVDYAPKITNVFQIQQDLMVEMFSNSLITRTKRGDLMLKYFDDLEPTYCKSAAIYLLAMKYRRTFYDFIYKSRHEAISKVIFEDIMLTGILEDIRLDQFKNNKNSEYFNIRRKLNILFSLHTYFQPHIENHFFMANQTIELRSFVEKLARAEVNISQDSEYAFAAGQVIQYIFRKSKSEDRSYKRLEPFLQQTDPVQFRLAIERIFNTYKHELYSKKFQHPFAEVMGYLPDGNLRELRPLVLSGFFSQNLLKADPTELVTEDEGSEN